MISKKRKDKFKIWLVAEVVILFGLASIASMCFAPIEVQEQVHEPAAAPRQENVASAPEVPAQLNAQPEQPVAKSEVVVEETGTLVNDQMILAALWMQRSAEYRAMCYQAYNIALERLAWATVARDIANDAKAKPLALVLDCEETVLTSDGQAEAMPGAVEFLKAVENLGVEIFYIANAPYANGEALIQSMSALGLPKADTAHVLLANANAKEPHFERIATDYEIVVYMGDSLDDMHFNAYNIDEVTRNAIADANKNSSA